MIRTFIGPKGGQVGPGLIGLLVGPFVGAVTPPPPVSGAGRPGLILLAPRIMGHLDVTAATADFTASGLLRIRSSLELSTATAAVDVSGKIMLRAKVSTAAALGRGTMRGAIANPGEWVIVVEEEQEAEEILVITSS